jgi:hypothetical protein
MLNNGKSRSEPTVLLWSSIRRIVQKRLSPDENRRWLTPKPILSMMRIPGIFSSVPSNSRVQRSVLSGLPAGRLVPLDDQIGLAGTIVFWRCDSQLRSRQQSRPKALKLVARPDRFERPTPWFEAKCSIQMSYGRFSQHRIT